MGIIDETNWHCFLDCVGDLLFTPEVQSMRDIPHHPGTCCYEHSVFVAYVAFRLARRWNLDYMAAARGGGGEPGRQAVRHCRGAGLLEALPCPGEGHELTAVERQNKKGTPAGSLFLPFFR